MDTQRSSTIDTGIDSKIAHAYDEAIERAQKTDSEGAQHGEEADGPHELLPTDLHESDPGFGGFGAIRETEPTTLESSLGPGEDLRDHDFPAPAGAMTGGSGKLLVNQNTLPEDESRRGGRPGTRPGDNPRLGIVPSILDQDAVAPDLAQEQD